MDQHPRASRRQKEEEDGQHQRRIATPLWRHEFYCHAGSATPPVRDFGDRGVSEESLASKSGRFVDSEASRFGRTRWLWGTVARRLFGRILLDVSRFFLPLGGVHQRVFVEPPACWTSRAGDDFKLLQFLCSADSRERTIKKCK